MYQALYRKWRPKTFDEVVGQEHITTTLKNEIASGRPSHAYLLMGTRGTGKTTCAKLIAKAVNCLDPRDGNPCGVCEICRGIDNGSVVDVVEIDAASNNGVDNIRDLREEALFLPNLAKYRVYIVDEAHMLSGGAVNALLKILEEPPEHVIFILATTEIHKMPATIQSRCQRFDFKRIDSAAMIGRLGYICSQEGITIEDDALALIARISDGGMRDALSLLDLCRGHSESITSQTVCEASGLIGQDYLFDLADRIAAKDLSGALELIDEIGGQSIEYDRLCGQLIGHYRNLLVAASAKHPEKLMICLPETLESYKKQAGALSPAAMISNIRLLREAQAAMARTPNRRTELEIAAAKLCDPRLSPSVEALEARLDELEAKIKLLAAREPGEAPRQTAAPSPAPERRPQAAQPSPPPPKAEEAPAAEPAKAVEKQTARQPDAVPTKPAASKAATSPAAPDEGQKMSADQWEQVLACLARTNGMLYAALCESVAYISGSRVLVSCDNDIFIDMMRSNETTKTDLKNAIAQVTGVKYAIGPYTPAAQQPKAEDDPLEGFLRQAQSSGVDIEIK